MPFITSLKCNTTDVLLAPTRYVLLPNQHREKPTRYIARDDNIPDVVFCFCPPGVINAIWELSDAILPDNLADNKLKDALPFFSPPIKKAHSVYASMPNDSPIKQFSSI